MATDTPTRRESGAGRRREVLLSKLNPLTMPLRYQIGLLGLLGLVLLPTLLFPSQMTTFIYFFYIAMFAMSWDAVSGYTGQISFGHAFFFAVGGYSTAVLNVQHGVSPLLSIPIAVVITALAGVAVGVPALRLRGPYLSLVTLILPILFLKGLIIFSDEFVLFGVPIAPGGLGGISGLTFPPDPLVAAGEAAVVNVATLKQFFPAYTSLQITYLADYYLSLALFLVVLAVLLAVTRSSAGSVFTAIREDEDAVAASGLNPAKFKVFAFVLSAAVGGLAGAALVHSVAGGPRPAALLGGTGQARSPILLSINVIIITIIGGTSTIVGPVVGTVAFAATQQGLGLIDYTIPVINKEVSTLRPLPLLLATMFVLVFQPQGILHDLLEGGRDILAKVRGEEREGGDDTPFEETALGQIVDNYREELRKITGDDGDNR